MSDSSLALARLRRRLERLELRRAVAPADLFALGHDPIDQALGGGLAKGRLHEIFATEGEAGGGSGFLAMLGQRAGMRAGAGKPLLWLRSEAAQKRAGLLHASGLLELGLDPAALLLGLVPDEPALLRAAGDASRCAGLGALLVECWGPMRGLDLTASRRLLLAAEASGVTVLVLRVEAEPCPSAADTRWRVAAAPSRLLEADAPGAPMLDLELLRRRAGPPAGPWRVEWNRDRQCFQEPDPIAESPLSRPVLPVATGRAPAAQPLRRAV